MSKHLGAGLDDVRMVGIWGMGGIGKTTIAKAVYNKFCDSFEGSSFLANVRETTKQPNGLVRLQEQLLCDILKTTKIKVGSVDRGINLIKDRLRCRRVLVIIDDIDQLDQQYAIAGNSDWFGLGSRLVITTRDERLLNQLGVDSIYPAPEMNETEALELFSWHAFRNMEKCIGEMEDNSSWPNSGKAQKIGISVLLERRLVTVCEKNKLMMHDLLRDMGREIVRAKSPGDPGKCSRLWHPKDVTDVLTEHSVSTFPMNFIVNACNTTESYTSHLIIVFPGYLCNLVG
ncbi:putative winged helix-turn-helix DNA-binding domain-containing protein [Rosa chinensis]|uniref:Putative winged helix-turn-helix DNA-binding domain-containing protein n=1 Tax=Rosa chinensis TaxID=74649 RepID=A0A2P6PFK3_ROSCH|nr:putative winged helix-turn-helix DNA-binding domain-containing protein [Rosa chinensis]